MIFGKESFRKKNNGKYIIGYQLEPTYVQISFLRIGEEQPFTFSLVGGMEEYNIPLYLCKKAEDNLWLIGKDAVDKKAERKDAVVEDLLSLAYAGKEVRLLQEVYSPCALLALFIRKSLSLLSLETSIENIAAIQFVVDWLDEKRVEALRQVAEYLQLPGIEIQFMGKEESFFWYNLHTDQSLWRGQVILFELQNEQFFSYRLYVNRQTTPLVTIVEKNDLSDLCWIEEGSEEADQAFLHLCRRETEGSEVSAIYLIGAGFAKEWYHNSLKFLCQNRRVFRGNNLYSKGACHGLLQKLEPDKLGQTYVYLGEDKLLANVGMNLLRQGEVSYLAILNGGNNWFDCIREWDVILDRTNQIGLRITPLNGRGLSEHTIVLDGLDMENRPYTRIHLEMSMSGPGKLLLKVWDRGFGQFYPSTDRCWEESIGL